MSLVKYFNKNSALQTDIGEFTFVGDIGSGGNAAVLKFKRGAFSFAVKFVSNGDKSKVCRFQDEFFCLAQVPTHKNVVRAYHFDTVMIENSKYFLIVMKLYDDNLNALGSLVGKSAEERAEKGLRLFNDLLDGMEHLHTHNIIHRDLKPQNIFYDANINAFVIGDLGIAHFKSDAYEKQARTKPSERLANYRYSAPEQVNSQNSVTAAADIYSLAQVMQWYLAGEPIRGLGRPQFSPEGSTTALSILDDFAAKALMQSASARFQSINEIKQFVLEKSQPKNNPWKKILAFDKAIRRSFPEIRTTLETSNAEEIKNFVSNFQQDCEKSDFWYVMADGGDNRFEGLEQLACGRWLLNDWVEIGVTKLLVHRDGNFPYKNFFILLFGPDQPFNCFDFEGNPVDKSSSKNSESDVATLMDGKLYIDQAAIRNGYYRFQGTTHHVDLERFRDRQRYLVSYGLMIVPTGTASATMVDRDPTSRLILASIDAKTLRKVDLDLYVKATRSHHSLDITKYN